MRNRSFRRHQRNRMQYHAYHVLAHSIYCDEPNINKIQDKAPYYRDNLKICSCWMCRNPRRNVWNRRERLTRQERRNLDKFKDELKEVLS